MRRSITLVLVVAALAVLGACGDDDGDTSSDTTSAAPTSTTPSGFTGEDSAELCTLARDYTAKFRAVGGAVSNPAQLKNLLNELQPVVSEAVADAPSEIKPDMEYLAEQVDNLRRILDDGRTPTAQDVAFASAPQTVRILAYGQEVCGITP